LGEIDSNPREPLGPFFLMSQNKEKGKKEEK